MKSNQSTIVIKSNNISYTFEEMASVSEIYVVDSFPLGLLRCSQLQKLIHNVWLEHFQVLSPTNFIMFIYEVFGKSWKLYTYSRRI